MLARRLQKKWRRKIIIWNCYLCKYDICDFQVKNAAETIAKGAVGVDEEREGRRELRKGLRKRSSKKSRTTMDHSQREIKVEPDEAKQAGEREEVAAERGSFLPAYSSELAVPEQNQLAMNQLNNLGFYFQQFPFFFAPQNQ